MKLTYIAAPFTADTPEGIQENIDRAAQLAAEVNDAGNGEVFAIVPHTMTAPVWQKMKHHKKANDDFWYRGDIELLKRCDAIVLGKGWELSKGCRREGSVAYFMDLPIYYADRCVNIQAMVDHIRQPKPVAKEESWTT